MIFYWLWSIPLWLGCLNVKLNRHSLPSERFGDVPTMAALGLRLTWRRAGTSEVKP